MDIIVKSVYTNKEKQFITDNTQFLPQDTSIAVRVRYIINGFTEVQTCGGGNPLLSYTKGSTDLWKYCKEKTCGHCKSAKSVEYSKAIKLSYDTDRERTANHKKSVDKLKSTGHYSKIGKMAWSNEENRQRMTRFTETDEFAKSKHDHAIRLWGIDEYRDKCKTAKDSFLDCDSTRMLRAGSMETDELSRLSLEELFLKYNFKRSRSYIKDLIFDVYGITPFTKTSKEEAAVLSMMKRLDETASIKRFTQVDEMRFLELDVFSEKLRLAIEINGIYWHSSDSESHLRHKHNRHALKLSICKSMGIRLLQFTDYEIQESPELVDSIIKSAVGLYTNRLYARKLSLAYISKPMAYSFFDANHIKRSSRKIGRNVFVALLDSAGTIVTCMHFNIKQNTAELERYASLKNTIVVGGASRLFRHFIADHREISSVLSYSYNDYFTGSVYKQLGFINEGNVEGYGWTEDCRVINHRSMYTKDRLLKRFSWATSEMTEYEICYRAGFRKYMNSGYQRWVYYV